MRKLTSAIQYFIGAAVVVFALSCVQARAAEGHIWYVDQKTIVQVNTDTFTTVQTSTLSDQAVAIAVDTRDKSVWVLSKKAIHKLDASFAPLFSFDLTNQFRIASKANAAFPSAEHLVINPYDGSVWIAGGKDVLHLDGNGAPLHSWSGADVIDDFELGIDEYLWVLTGKAVVQLSKFGVPVGTVPIDVAQQNPRFQTIDNLRARLWLADKGKLQRYSLADTSLPPASFAVKGASTATVQPTGLAGNFETGDIWLADNDTLYQFDTGGTLLRKVDLSASGIKNPRQLLWDPVGRMLWVGDDTHLAAFSVSSELATIIATKKLQAVATDQLVLQPVFELTYPTHNIYINTGRPAVTFRLAGSCNYSPCLDAALYGDNFLLNTFLDSQSIGQEIAKGSGVGAYLPPTDLAEGAHTVTGYAIDPFGHTSSPIESLFVVDTIPPAFRNIQPADNSTVQSTPVTLTGDVDDTSPVIVELKDRDGQILGSAGRSFSFPLSLVPGQNEFKLTATDAAGNQASAPVRVSLGDPISIEINRPLESQTTGLHRILVMGEFDGPVNSGVVVNGTLATTAGRQFYASIELPQLGVNEVTAVLTTASGQTVSDTVHVNATAEANSSSGSFTVSVTGDLQAPDATPQISSLAGTGEGAWTDLIDNVPAIQSHVWFPAGIVSGPDGSVFIAERNRHTIRKVDSEGIITTVAGLNRQDGFSGDGAMATQAKLYNPTGVAVDAEGNLYIADYGNHRVRKVGLDGIITTVAGSGNNAWYSGAFSGDGGPAVEAQLDRPSGVAVDRNGVLYIADTWNHRIRRVDGNGVITTIAGSGGTGVFGGGFAGDGGPATSALMKAPTKVAIGSGGDLYIADNRNNRIRRVSGDTISTLAGNGQTTFNGDGKPAIETAMGLIDGLAIHDDGSLFFSDFINNRIRKIDTSGIVSTVAGTGDLDYYGDNGPATDAAMRRPAGIALLPDGRLAITDMVNNRVRQLFFPTVGSIQYNADIFVNFTGSSPVSKIEFDFESDGVFDQTVYQYSTGFKLHHVFPGPGVALLTVRVTDTTGAEYTVVEPVAVLDKEKLTGLMQELWTSMNAALVSGDIPKAETYLTVSAKDRYHSVFLELKDKFSTSIPTYGTLEPISINSNFMEGSVVREIENQPYIFFIYWLKDETGVWRLEAM